MNRADNDEKGAQVHDGQTHDTPDEAPAIAGEPGNDPSDSSLEHMASENALEPDAGSDPQATPSENQMHESPLEEDDTQEIPVPVPLASKDVQVTEAQDAPAIADAAGDSSTRMKTEVEPDVTGDAPDITDVEPDVTDDLVPEHSQLTPESETTAPETVHPESTAPDLEQPEATAPGLEHPEASAAKIATPEANAPDRLNENAEDYIAEISFEDLGLSPELLQGLEALGYAKPTPIQAAAYPLGLEGTDLVARSKTGTGKTAAFLLPIISKIKAGDRKTRALILAPTRELAIQVANEGIALAKFKDISVVPIYGGVGLGPQADQLRAGANIVVGTPGRLLDHLRRGNLDLSQADFSVLDEADEMLSMGFLEEVRTLLRRLPESHTTFLFSATVDSSVSGLINEFMTDPEELFLSTDKRTVDHIHNVLYEVSGEYPKARSLLYVLYLEQPESAIIFCNTRDDCSFITNYMRGQGFEVEFINSDLAQRERERVMNRVKGGELSFLVATDIAARGIDISDLTHVINYSLPEDPDLYLHRVGRTGRIGKLGTALSLTSGRELTAELALTKGLKINFDRRNLPSAEEAEKLWAEMHIKRLRKAMDTTAFESFVPVARHMVETLPPKQLHRLMATALRIFFSWAKGDDVQERRAQASEGEGRRHDRDDGRRGRSRDRGRGRDPEGDRDGRPPRGEDRERGRGRGREGDRDRSRGRGREPERGRDRSRGQDRDSERGGDRATGRTRDGREDERSRRPREDERRPRDDGRRPRDDGRRPRDDHRHSPRGDDRPRDPQETRQRLPREETHPDGRADAAETGGPERGDGRRRRRRKRRDGSDGSGDAPRAPQSTSRPPDELIDPLAAFAAANDLDLDAWIDSGESDDDRGNRSDAPVQRPESSGEDEGRKRRRRRNGRRRRRGPEGETDSPRQQDSGDGSSLPAGQDAGAAVEAPQPSSATRTADNSEPSSPTRTVDNSEPWSPTRTADNSEPWSPTRTADNSEPSSPTRTADNSEPSSAPRPSQDSAPLSAPEPLSTSVAPETSATSRDETPQSPAASSDEADS